MTSALMAYNPVLDEHANAIRALRSRVVEDVAEIGRILTEAKETVGHGNWLPWLDREFGWEETTALNFMRVHKFVQELQSESANVCVFHMPVSSVYLLAAPSTPPEAREEIIERVSAGETVPVTEVKRTIESAKARQRPKKTEAQRAQEAERRRAQKGAVKRARYEAIRAQLPEDIEDILDKAERAHEDFVECTVDVWEALAKEVVDHAKAETFARAAVAAWTRLADGIRKKAVPTGNGVDPEESAKAMRAAHAKSPAAPVAKKRGRPAGSKNKPKQRKP